MRHLTGLGMYEILARVIMLIVALVPFFAFWEIDHVHGPGKLAALFFSKQSETSSALSLIGAPRRPSRIRDHSSRSAGSPA